MRKRIVFAFAVLACLCGLCVLPACATDPQTPGTQIPNPQTPDPQTPDPQTLDQRTLDPQTPAAQAPYPEALPTAGTETAPEKEQSFSEWFQDVSLLLGTSLEEAFQSFGAPLRIGSARGEEPWQDDVIFEYAGGLSLFWYRDRVWQLRFGPGFHTQFSDIGMGSSREDIAAVLGKPFHAEEDWVLYHFAGQGYPVRLRLFFGEKGLEDMYIYRGDF